jgi:hypothetical protein
MTDDRPDEPHEPAPEPARESAHERAERRRRLAEIFGDVIPEQTGDDTDESGAADRRTEGEVQEDWLKRQVPPHHG